MGWQRAQTCAQLSSVLKLSKQTGNSAQSIYSTYCLKNKIVNKFQELGQMSLQLKTLKKKSSLQGPLCAPQGWHINNFSVIGTLHWLSSTLRLTYLEATLCYRGCGTPLHQGAAVPLCDLKAVAQDCNHKCRDQDLVVHFSNDALQCNSV